LIEIKNLIYVIRGQKVMLDSDLAMLYGVLTKNLNKAVKRNIQRFPEDFMFQITKEEYENLKFQFGTSNNQWGGRRTLPFVFTEQGISMLSSVLQSEQAIAINIQIMRMFVKIKQYAIEHQDLQEQIVELKNYFIQYAQDNNAEIDRINEAINLLLDRTKPEKIGFKTD
ncbi:MAG: ORF6N domain-containing protein, partial [Candidatus Gastranaerophilales bacterium]|nr:ORF6N domain-containing protein [Candidatus Gastranaerophilales bacterium]